MGCKKEFVVELSAEEKVELQSIVKQGYHASRVIRRAQTLLWLDEGKSDKEIAQLHDVSLGTVGNTRKKWVLERTVEDKPRPVRPPVLDGKQDNMWSRPKTTLSTLANHLDSRGFVFQVRINSR